MPNMKEEVLRAMYRQQLKNYRLKPWLAGPIFEPLIEHYFKKFFIDGLTIAWSKGVDKRLKSYMGSCSQPRLRPENQARHLRKPKLAN